MHLKKGIKGKGRQKKEGIGERKRRFLFWNVTGIRNKDRN